MRPSNTYDPGKRPPPTPQTMPCIQTQPKHPRKDNKGNKSPASPPRLYPTPQYHLSSSHRPPHSSHGGSSGENASAGPSVDARQGPEHLQAPQGARAGGSSTTAAKVLGPPEPASFRGGDEEPSDSGTSGTGWVRSRWTRRFLLFLLLPDEDPGATMADELPTSPTASSVPPQKGASSLSATGSATEGSGTSSEEGATTADTATGFSSTPPQSEGGASSQSESKFETGPPTPTTTSKGGGDDGITIGATFLRGSSSASPPKARGLSGSSPPPNTVTIETAGDDGGLVGVGALLGARRADSSFAVQ